MKQPPNLFTAVIYEQPHCAALGRPTLLLSLPSCCIRVLVRLEAEADVDHKRHYYRPNYLPISAEMRAAILAPESAEECAPMDVSAFTDHLKSMSEVGGQPRIWAEIAPHSSTGASCRKVCTFSSLVEA